MSQRVSVNDAAREIGCAPQALREHMKRGLWDLGEVVPPDKKSGSYVYYIFRPKLDKFLGKEERNKGEEEETEE